MILVYQGLWLLNNNLEGNVFDESVVSEVKKTFPLSCCKIRYVNENLRYEDKKVLNSCKKAVNSGNVILALKKSLSIKNHNLKRYTINYLTYVLCGSLRQSFVNEVLFKKNNSYVLPIFCFLNNFTSKLLTDILDDLQDYNKQNLIESLYTLKALFLNFCLKQLKLFNKEKSVNNLILQLNGIVLSLDGFDSLLRVFDSGFDSSYECKFKIMHRLLKKVSAKIEKVANFINVLVEGLYSNNNYIEIFNINLGDIKALISSNNIIFSIKSKSCFNGVLNIVNELKEEDVKRKLQNGPKEKPITNLQADASSKYSFFKLNYWW